MCIIPPQATGKLEFARRAGGQFVSNLACYRSAFGYRSVSFYGLKNWNLIDN